MKCISVALSITLCLYVGMSDVRAEWQEVARDAVRARVLMPGQPKIWSDDVKTEIGALTFWYAVWETETVAYTFMHTEYPIGHAKRRGVEQFMKTHRELASKNGRRLLKHHRLTIHGYPAQQILAQEIEGVWLLARQILINDNLYQLVVTARSNPEQDTGTNKFLNSFSWLRM